MLDLSKSYGSYDNIVFFGDHQDDTIIYYLPDEVKVATKPNREDEYEFSLMLFHNNKMVDASRDDLEDSAGSILTLDVICMVAPERLQNAFAQLRSTIPSIPSEAMLTTPLWTDGSVDLITLDKSLLDDTIESDLVKIIVSSQRPSLTQEPRAAFIDKYDKHGTELIHTAIKNSQSALIAAYDLQFVAIQPAIDLKITANLSRCQETARKNIDAEIKVPIKEFELGLAAHFEGLTKIMKENDDIKIEYTSHSTDPEEKRQADQLVKEFEELVLNELFKPALFSDDSSLADDIVPIIDALIPFKANICYRFNKQAISQERILSVDYSERSAIVKRHNPNALLLNGDTTIADHYDDYVKKVVLGESWNKQSVDIELFNDFTDPNNDLLSAEVILWKHKDGMLDNVPENHFAIPEKTKPLGYIVFRADEKLKTNVSWSCDDEDDEGYYYQFRFVYSSDFDNHFSPTEIVTQPTFSFSRTLAVTPSSYMFFRSVPIIPGTVDFSVFDNVEIIVDVEDSNGVKLTKKPMRFLLKEHSEEFRFLIRGKDHSKLNIWVTKIYHFKDLTKAPLTFPHYLLKDYAIIVDSPLIVKEILPTILGSLENVEKIVFTCKVTSPVLSHPVSTTKTLDYSSEDTFSIIIYTPEDVISYEVSKIYKDTDGKRKKQKVLVGEIVASELSTFDVDLDLDAEST